MQNLNKSNEDKRSRCICRDKKRPRVKVRGARQFWDDLIQLQVTMRSPAFALLRCQGEITQNTTGRYQKNLR